MSNEAIRLARKVRGLSSGAMHQLALIADHANRDWEAWMSQRRLAEDSACSEDTVQRRNKEIENFGIFTRSRRGNTRTGGRCTDLYKLRPDVMRSMTTEGNTAKSGSTGEGNTANCGLTQGGNTAIVRPTDNEPSKKNPQREGAQAPSRSKVSVSGKGRSKDSTIPDDFAPTADNVAFGKTLGLTEGQIRYQVPRFVKKFKAIGAKKSDWSATFDEWVEREIGFMKGLKNMPSTKEAAPLSKAKPSGPAFVVSKTMQFHKWCGYFYLTGTPAPELVTDSNGKRGWSLPSEYPPMPTIWIDQDSDQYRAWMDHCRETDEHGEARSRFVPFTHDNRALVYSEWPPMKGDQTRKAA